MPELTKRQEEILNFIRDHIECVGFPPSIREIGKAFGISSPNGVTCHLKALAKKGHLFISKETARGIALTHKVCPHCGKEI